jgi:photoactive yellow protein
MDHVSFKGVDLAELLPRIPDSIKNGLPFGLVKLDLSGKILEYNMTEGQIVGVDPAWAIGKNFFDEVAVCTKTAAFYGRFVEGVRKGFLNAVFDYTFDHRQEATRVRVHMVTVPDHLGRMNVMILVKRTDRPAVTDAIGMRPAAAVAAAPAAPPAPPQPAAVPVAREAAPAAAAPSIEDIVRAVVAVLNQVAPAPHGVAPAAAQPPAVAVVAAPPPPAAPPGKPRHEDIIKF